MPVPDKLTLCGLSELLSLMTRDALSGPVLSGLNVTPILHVAVGATLEPQGADGVRRKSRELAPAMATELIVSAELPVLVKTTVCAGLVVPLTQLPKFRAAGTSFTVPEETMTVTAADLLGSVTELAVRVIAPAGTPLGAVYVVAIPLAVVLGEILPQAAEHAVLPSVKTHLTPWFIGSFPTVALNCWEMFTGIRALVGAAETVIAGTVTAEAPDTAGLKTEVAVIVTARSLVGTVAGAV